ncbi:TetR/AcrR family transcriptional regulator [Nocardioides sp. Bht2]|uniref:TetR/AcrR family transcriptional regulator n=1 Tax=Nocardioides sp. Bht2 TaxID=3392297 RepID=UPI0039B5C4C1
MSRVATQRSYGGRTAAERRAQRRTALLEAGRDLWCEQGWAAVTMRGVCARAGVTDRYFYENFTDRDALLAAVAGEVRQEVTALLLASVEPHLEAAPAVQLRVALETIIDFIATNAGNTQIFFGDHGGSDLLEAMRRETIGTVVDLFRVYVEPHLAPDVSDTELRVVLLVGIGGFVETATAWRAGEIQATAPELVEMLMGVSRRLGHGLIDLGE